ASVLQGGAEFATLTSGGRPVEDGHVFTLQTDQATAQANKLAEDDSTALRVLMRVGESVKGLDKGANVQFMGLTVGHVSNLAARIITDDQGREHVEQEVTLVINPTRLGLSEDAPHEDALDFLARQVQAGLRARVASAGFFGTSLQVELVSLSEAAPAELD